MQSLSIRVCRRVNLWLTQNKTGCGNGVSCCCWNPAWLKVHHSSSRHGKLSQLSVQQERRGGAYRMWTSLCCVPPTLPGHGKQKGSSGVITASGLTQHLVKKLLQKVAEKLWPWVKRAGSALLMEVKGLVCSSICRSDCVQICSKTLFYYFIPFYFKIFTIGFHSGTILK